MSGVVCMQALSKPVLNPASALADLRISYEYDELLESQVANNPIEQFIHWFNQALVAKIPEPNAMTLATVGQDCQGIWRPSSRVVLLKGVDATGLTWFTNYNSRKGKELAVHPYASLQFHWMAFERQVRFEGRVEPLSPEDSDAYFDSRPVGSRIGACVSPQSQVITDRAVLEQAMSELNAVVEQAGEVPKRPNHWGGYCLKPDRVEFWQGRPNRLHDRLCYRLNDDQTTWHLERLAP
jgi:pyridoxamine 5'-phosphate oxidase